jgi:CRISPR-associated protein Cas2
MSLIHRYRSMWVQVLFDLPVVRKVDRIAATQFRNNLLDLGFSMLQFSVYLKFCPTKDQVDTITKKIELSLPEYGKVHIICFTDKQYETVVTFKGRSKKKSAKNPDQFTLF